MDFQNFLNMIPKIEVETLLAEVAHRKMSPPERMAIMAELDLEVFNPRKSAVMMLFYPKDSETHLVLIVRNSYPGVHSSQIAFPGGKMEEDDLSLLHAALRETHEEIGVPPEKIAVIRAFSQVYIPPSNYMVYPFMGYSEEELVFTPDSDEVADIIEVSLRDFLDDRNIVSQRMATSYSDSIEVPAFKINDHYVWGATAMMLSELKEILIKVL